eukprot:jgi/Chrzof1/7972/UNPLg00895.t1
MANIPKKGRLSPDTAITVIEAGYRNDHNREDKIREKEEQHKDTGVHRPLFSQTCTARIQKFPDGSGSPQMVLEVPRCF